MAIGRDGDRRRVLNVSVAVNHLAVGLYAEQIQQRSGAEERLAIGERLGDLEDRGLGEFGIRRRRRWVSNCLPSSDSRTGGDERKAARPILLDGESTNGDGYRGASASTKVRGGPAGRSIDSRPISEGGPRRSRENNPARVGPSLDPRSASASSRPSASDPPLVLAARMAFRKNRRREGFFSSDGETRAGPAGYPRKWRSGSGRGRNPAD